MGKVVYVGGPGGSGKTTLASAIASALARKDRYVILVSPDKYHPAMGLWMPDNAETVSIGEFMAHSEINAIYVLNQMMGNFMKKPRLLGVLGYKPGESVEKYNPIEEQAAFSFFSAVENIPKINSDCDPLDIVVDGTVYGDALSSVAQHRADINIQIFEPDPRGVVAFDVQKSNLPAKTLFVAYQRNTFDLITDIPSRLGISWTAIVPMIDEAHRKLTDRCLFDAYQNRQYAAAVDRLVRSIMEV